MADIINKVKLPDNKTYNIEGSVHYVCGTQTAATGAWTGNLNLPALYDGLTIMYYLPWAGSGNATLNLTLSDGSTTGAKNCYYNTSRLTTHYGKGCNIIMTYHPAGSITVDGTATTDDRWIANANYADGNDTSTLHQYYSHPTAGGSGMKQYSLFAFTHDGKVSSFTTNNGTGTKTFDTSTAFDFRKIYYFNNSNNVAVGTAIGNNQISVCENLVDMRYTFNGVTTDASTSSLVANKPLYLVTEQIPTSPFITSRRLKSPYFAQELTDNSAIYVLVGYMNDSYRCNLLTNNTTWRFSNGSFGPYEIVESSLYAGNAYSATNANYVNNHTVYTDVPANAVFTDTKVTQSPNDSTANNFEVLFSTSADNTSKTEAAQKSSKLKFNPSTGNLQATQLNGVAIGSSPKFTDTTYTFAGGTNKITVTPSGGTAQDVAITVSDSTKLPLAGGTMTGTINLASTGLKTNNADGYTTDAHGNFIHSSTTSTNYFNLNSNDKTKQLKYYWETGNLEVPGTIKTNSKSVAYLTATPTTGQVVVTDGTTGGVKTTGYTIATSVPSGAVFTDTKNTAGSTDTSSKIFLIGATSQATNPQTYSDNEVYATSGVLTTKSVQVGGTACTMQYNSTTQSLDFVFA